MTCSSFKNRLNCTSSATTKIRFQASLSMYVCVCVWLQACPSLLLICVKICCFFLCAVHLWATTWDSLIRANQIPADSLTSCPPHQQAPKQPRIPCLQWMPLHPGHLSFPAQCTQHQPSRRPRPVR